MKKTSVNNKPGYLVFNSQRNRGSFLTVISGVKGKRAWKYLRIHDMMKVRPEKERIAYRRRRVTDYDRDKAHNTVTNHTDVIIDLIPDICLRMMEVYREEMGISRAEADIAMKEAETKNMDQIDHLLSKIGGQIG